MNTTLERPASPLTAEMVSQIVLLNREVTRALRLRNARDRQVCPVDVGQTGSRLDGATWAACREVLRVIGESSSAREWQRVALDAITVTPDLGRNLPDLLHAMAVLPGSEFMPDPGSLRGAFSVEVLTEYARVMDAISDRAEALVRRQIQAWAAERKAR